MKDFFSKLNFFQLVLLELIFFFFILAFGLSVILPIIELPDLRENGHEFSLLADSFLEGKLYLDKFPKNGLDCTVFNDKCYWGQGPMPAVVLLPFVFLFNLFNLPFYQGYLNIIITALIFFLCWRLAKKFKYSFIDSLWLAFAFCFASVYLGIAFNSFSYYFAQAVVVLFLFLSLYEYLAKRRYWLIGLFFAFIFATRFTAGLGILFFVLTIFFDKQLSFKNKIQHLILMFTPIIASGLLLLYYNFVRFGDFFDNGYMIALPWEGYRENTIGKYGLFNLKYFFSNLYYYFIKIPEPVLENNYLLVPPYFRASSWGLSFFIVSPIFIKIFWVKIKNQVVKFSWLVSLVILFIIMTYYNSGHWQFGPRYILDLLPFWFLLLLYSFRDSKLANSHYLIISLSAIVNFYLFISLF